MPGEGFLKQEEKEFSSFYKRSLWWVEHREQLRKLGLVLLAIFDAGLLSLAAWVLVDSFVLSYGIEERAVSEMAVYNQSDLRGFSVGSAADVLSVGNVQVISSGENRFDFYTTLSNPNADWYAEFDYAFAAGDEQTETASGFILPGEEKPLAFLAFEGETRPATARVVIENIVWRRVDGHEIQDYDAWFQERLGLTIEDVAFSRELEIDSEEIGRVSFTVRNTTAYSYWEPSFTILLMRGGSVAGVTRTTLTRLKSGDERSVAVNWFGSLPAVTKVEVIPEVNLFDPDVYMPLSAR